MYKIGDKVKVREDLVIGKSYGDVVYCSANAYCLSGQVCTIADIVERAEKPLYYLKEYEERFHTRQLGGFSKEMFENNT